MNCTTAGFLSPKYPFPWNAKLTGHRNLPGFEPFSGAKRLLYGASLNDQVMPGGNYSTSLELSLSTTSGDTAGRNRRELG